MFLSKLLLHAFYLNFVVQKANFSACTVLNFKYGKIISITRQTIDKYILDTHSPMQFLGPAEKGT